MNTVKLTPSQTVGPFFSHALTWLDGPDVVAEDAPGAIWLRGRVFDGAGEPVPDALIESWQADPDGRFDHPDDPRGAVPGFRGYGRSATDDDGRWGIRTLLPGRVPGVDGRLQAPHVDLSVFARGLLDRVVTRVYFADQPSNSDDAVLSALPADRRSTLIAPRSADGYTFDIRLQGERETVFFSL
ncbi:protocatechuate 3,4-dioxygenase subunit alpha [Actinophytocola gossypii]|uniref:Protocatechuate 3,4-dioxygenase subunit alpha n=1 Tax=Actinophytocola gossypii TaxID=2812003 RepID=A0ABT2JJM7_9PSEU|nr:protocatechuate 3,4-dioxygenase subunit alpha [Actinophytocola gossypii]MCT2588087.1 protocatechuate 3,4-dioxygenase subunit alpha [Actinophytocola gossypii]